MKPDIDDMQVTKNGQENLTITPKGDEALKIVQEGPKYKWTARQNSPLEAKYSAEEYEGFIEMGSRL